MSELTGPRFEPLTFRSRGERVATRPTGRCSEDLALEECSIIVMLYLLKQIYFSAQKLLQRQVKLVSNKAVGA